MDSKGVLSVRKRFLYGCGGILDQWGVHGVKNLANPVFNIILGVNPAVVGTVVAVSRMWDAFADPIVGNVSDNVRTRWGRRRPFIAIGALACAMTFLPLWLMPSGVGAAQQTAWLLVASLVFYTAFAVFTVPYHALGYEIAPQYHQKTQLLAMRTVFTTVASQLAAWVFPLTQTGWLGDPVTSVRWLAVGVALLLLASGMVPALALREPRSMHVTRQAKIPLVAGLRAAAVSRPFLLLLGSAGLAVIGLNMVNALGTYVCIYYVFGGDSQASATVLGVASSFYGLAVLATVPLISFLARRLGKRGAYNWCLGFAFVGTLSKWWLYTPEHPWWQLGVMALLAPGMAGLWMLSESMVADVAEFEHHRGGPRSEGLYGAVYGWFLKSGLALGVFLSGLILVGSGFDVALGGGQTAETLLKLRLFYAVVPASAIVGAFFILRRYPLTAGCMQSIRAELDRRIENATTDA